MAQTDRWLPLVLKYDSYEKDHLILWIIRFPVERI
jgi:hypothetical protein